MTATPPSPATKRVLLISCVYWPTERVLEYAQKLVDHGIGVDLVAYDEERWREAGLPEQIRVFALMEAERRFPIRRLERFAVFRLPGGILALCRRAVSKIRLLDRAMEAFQIFHSRAGGAYHTRVFVPFYRVIRPLVIEHIGKRVVKKLDMSGIDRIVVPDLTGVKLGWRLAQARPDIIATMALETDSFLTHAS